MRTHTIIVALVSLLIGALARDMQSSTARAEDAPAFDRSLVEHIVRAQEQQADALKSIARTQEQQTRGLENIVRAIEHSK